MWINFIRFWYQMSTTLMRRENHRNDNGRSTIRSTINSEYSIHYENDTRFKPFITWSSKGNAFAHYKFCCKQYFLISFRDIADILRHIGMQKHSKIDKARKVQLSITQLTTTSKVTLLSRSKLLKLNLEDSLQSIKLPSKLLICSK